jgi:hypothetical protein
MVLGRIFGAKSPTEAFYQVRSFATVRPILDFFPYPSTRFREMLRVCQSHSAGTFAGTRIAVKLGRMGIIRDGQKRCTRVGCTRKKMSTLPGGGRTGSEFHAQSDLEQWWQFLPSSACRDGSSILRLTRGRMPGKQKYTPRNLWSRGSPLIHPGRPTSFGICMLHRVGRG